MKKLSLFIIILFFTNINFAQQQIIFTSPLLPAGDTVHVYKPKTYKDTHNYPLVFLMHGWSGNYKQWGQIVNLQDFADEYNFVIACPDGFYDCWYLNSPAKANSQFVTFFFNNLLPEMQQKYNINKTQIFISGLSMGGHGALYLYLQHPELFASAGSTSGALDLRGPAQRGGLGLEKIIGEFDKNLDKYAACSVIDNLSKIAGSEKEIIFDCGTEDFLYETNNAVRKKCDELKIKAVYITQPGEHNYAYWKKSIKFHFDFFSNKCK